MIYKKAIAKRCPNFWGYEPPLLVPKATMLTNIIPNLVIEPFGIITYSLHKSKIKVHRQSALSHLFHGLSPLPTSGPSYSNGGSNRLYNIQSEEKQNNS